MRQYEILEWDPVAADWASVAARSLDQVVYIGSTNFTDTEGDSKPDIVFRSNGTVNPYPVNGQVVIQTDANIPKNVWTVSLKETGNLSATSN
jgi:hypothetical protein